jgi:hypothetical protein
MTQFMVVGEEESVSAAVELGPEEKPYTPPMLMQLWQI